MAHYEEQVEETATQGRCFRNFTPEQEKDYKAGVKPEFSWRPDSEAVNGPVSSPIGKYDKALRSGTLIDVYDVLDAFKVDNPAIQHALKKMLCTGGRGHKDYQEDLQEAIDSLERAKSFPPIPF